MSRKRKRKGRDPRRDFCDRFARLPHRLLRSNAYRSLSPNERALLVELVMLHNGENNGSLYLGVRDAAHRMGIADLSAARAAFDNLISLGFIELTQAAYFSVKASKASRARCWRLTWLVGPGSKAPSWDFLKREPEPQTPARKRMERGLRALKAYQTARDRGRLPMLDTDTLNPFLLGANSSAVLESNTPPEKNGRFSTILSVRDSYTHLATPWGEGRLRIAVRWPGSEQDDPPADRSGVSPLGSEHLLGFTPASLDIRYQQRGR
jgi:hypothetical protein